MASATPDLLNAFVESIGDAVYVVDADGDVVFANRMALDMLGYTEDELIGRPSHPTIHYKRPDGGPFPESECPLLRPRMTGEVVRVDDDWVVRRDGSVLPVAYSSAPVATPAGRGAVVVFRDMRPRLELEEIRAREALERGRAEEVRDSRARCAAADAERRRLVRDLHDGAQQRIVHTIVTLKLARNALVGVDGEAPELAAEALGNAERALQELRELARGIHPRILSSGGLGRALEALAHASAIPVTLDGSREEQPSQRALSS